jgi:hypothetical protein
MEALFNPKNWSELINDRSLWNAAIILIIAITALLSALYADQIQEWRMHHQEKVKWFRWNR